MQFSWNPPTSQKMTLVKKSSIKSTQQNSWESNFIFCLLFLLCLLPTLNFIWGVIILWMVYTILNQKNFSNTRSWRKGHNDELGR